MKAKFFKKVFFLLAIISLINCSGNKNIWTLATDDTRITIGINDSSELYVSELTNPKTGWNWTEKPSVFPFINKIEIKNKSYHLKWVFQNAVEDLSEGKKITLNFKTEKPDLTLQSVWQARPGSGPVHHSMFITNKNSDTIIIYQQPSFNFNLSNSELATKSINLRYFSDNAFWPDSIGTYKFPVTKDFSKTILSTSGACWNGGNDYVPYAILDNEGQHGIYIGMEWSNVRTEVAGAGKEKLTGIQLQSGLFADFKTNVYPGESFEVPPGFIGAYNGDIDDAGNSLRKYLYNYNIPKVLREDKTYPKVSWNAILTTAKQWTAWYTEEKNYYPFIKSIAALGFDDVVVDINWWDQKSPRDFNPVDWSRGMLAARDSANKSGMIFTLYWNQNNPLTTDEGINKRIDDAAFLYNNYHIDVYRTDATNGPVINGRNGRNNRAQYKTDSTYWATKGFYKVLDSLQTIIPNFKWENCGCGAPISDFGAMKRSIRIQCTDMYKSIQTRMAFYDASFIYPPMQIEGVVAGLPNIPRTDIFPEQYDKKLMFRSSSMGAAWWIAIGLEGYPGHVAPWTEEQKQDIKKAVNTYKTRIKPLIRTANVYHIFPRPDGIHWDGIEYYDPGSKKGVVYIFKPILNDIEPVPGLKKIVPLLNDTTNHIKLKGIDPNLNYRLTFEDGTNKEAVTKGSELLEKGITVTLHYGITSELMFIENSEKE